MNIKSIIFGIIIFLVIQNIRPSVAVEVSITDAKNKVNNLIYHNVIDTRTEEERNSGYHVYSMNIPSANLNELSKKIKNKYNKILVISKTGERAKLDAELIASMRYRNVEYLNDVWTRLI